MKRAEADVPRSSYLLQATLNMFFYSHWSPGRNRTELSIPCPSDWLPHRCGTCGVCLSVSHSHVDEGEPRASKPPRWDQWPQVSYGPRQMWGRPPDRSDFAHGQGRRNTWLHSLWEKFFLRRRELTSFPREVPGCLVGTPKHKVALSEYSLMSRLHIQQLFSSYMVL